MMSSTEMYDVWVNEIVPKLEAIDIVRLSMVDQWARRIAHNTTHHCGYAMVSSISSYHNAVTAWPYLRWHLQLEKTNQDDIIGYTLMLDCNIAEAAAATAAATKVINTKKWCAVCSLTFAGCRISDFSFVESRGLEQFTFNNGTSRLDSRGRSSLSLVLLSCTHLVSLTLSFCIAKNDELDWLVQALTHLAPSLSHLGLGDNDLGAERAKRINRVLCHMPHLTSLNLGGNGIGGHSGGGGDSAVKEVCEGVCALPNITTLILQNNNIQSDDVSHLCAVLQNNRRVAHLGLAWNEMKSEGMKHILPFLAQMSQLTFLDVRVNDLDADLKSQVKELLSHVTKLQV
eukprot:c11438_g1_i1.p1 GENE.c11438_g1_i1~~c11438_g1_i1.p1  ORF type:complete len:343 (-),score=70.61 c11438_g1_i1:151-1179(-)